MSDLENADFAERPSSAPPKDKIQGLRDELKNLQDLNSEVSGKFEASNTGQGCLGLAIITTSTLIGVIVGFGFLSLLTGIGGFIIGVFLSGMVMRDKPEKLEYEKRKLRIQEIETILAQLS
jgi:hypothetical protein